MAARDILEYGGAFGGTAIPDSVVLSNVGAWHNTGTVLDSNGEVGLTIEQALPASGLDFTVVKTPIYVPVLDKEGVPKVYRSGPNKGRPQVMTEAAERRYGVVRTDTNYCLGVVGETWEPMQPIDGFQIVNDVIEQAGGKCWIESAGSIDGGRKIWVMAHINTELQIAGESYRSYLLFTTGFDGRLSTAAAAIDERVLCANTLNFAVFGEAKESGYIVRVRHTKNAGERIQEAHAILGMRNKRAEELAQQGEWLVEQSWDEGKFEDFLQTLMVQPEEEGPSYTMIGQRQDQVREIYHGPTCKPIENTAWAGVQAVLEYCDHGRNFKDVETQTRNQLGITQVALKQQAYELALDLSGFSAN